MTSKWQWLVVFTCWAASILAGVGVAALPVGVWW